jgi:hypothetical protein
VIIYREGPIKKSALAKLAGPRGAAVEETMNRLLASGRVRQDEALEDPEYRANSFVVPIGAEAGWEAALLDHFHALVRTICQKLRAAPESSMKDTTGGSTYTFAVWPEHPLHEEVLGSLRRFRESFSELRARVDEYNHEHVVPADYEQVVVYGGQSVVKQESEGHHDSSE